MTQPPSVTPSFQPPFMAASAPAEPARAPERLTKEAAFDLLRTVVSEFEAAGKQPYAAGVKPQMQARSNNSFSEVEFGFMTFREFVEAAAEAGAVEVEFDGPHMRMRVSGSSTSPSTRTDVLATPRESGRIHIPSHLWTAFVDWSVGKRRVFDRNTNTAIIFSATPTAGEPDGEAAKRELVAAAGPERFVEIQPLTFEVQVGWMREYAGTLSDGGDRRLLTLVLENDARPANAFNVFLRKNSHLLAAWKVFRVERVREAIRSWMNENEIDTRILDDARGEENPVERKHPETFLEVAQVSELERVRSRVHSIIDKMPLSELLRLSIPVEYLIGSE